MYPEAAELVESVEREAIREKDGAPAQNAGAEGKGTSGHMNGLRAED